MRNVNSLAKLSETQFQRLSKQVLGLAKESGQAPKVLAEGLYDIVSSGFEANDALKILRVSARAATAGMTDTATATRAINAALNAYHLPASKANDVSDVLFKTVEKGVITFAELAQNMGDMVPISAPLGVSLEEVGAAIATITLQGVPAAEAATRVKNVMLQLASPSKALAKLLHEQGFESGEAAIKAEGFVGVLELLDKATEGNVTKTAKLSPEIRSLMGIVGLTGRNLKTYKDNLEDMEGATEGAGATSEAFAEQGKAISVQWDKAKAGLTAAGISLATTWFPAVEGAIGLASDFAGWLERLGEQKTIRAKAEFTVAGIRGLGAELGDVLFGEAGKRIRVPIDQKHFEWQIVGGRQGLVDQVFGFVEKGFSAQAMSGSAGRRVRVPVDGKHWEWKIVGAREGWLDALQRELGEGIEDLDLARLSSVLGKAGGGLIQVAGVIAGAFAQLIGKAIREIDWAAVGSEIADGMGAAGERLAADVAKAVSPERFEEGVKVAAQSGLSDQQRFVAMLGFDPNKDYSGDVTRWFTGQVGRAFGRITPEDLGVSEGGVLGDLFETEEAQGAVSGLAGKVDGLSGKVNILGSRLDKLPPFIKTILENNALQAAGQVEEYRAALNRVASMPPIFKTITTIEERRSVVLGGTSGPPRAMGGFVPGQGAVPMVLHGGEVVLNRGQQARFGGPGFFKRMFGFTGGEGPSYASGGIVGRLPGGSVDALEQKYGLLQRMFGLPRSPAGEELSGGETRSLIRNRRGLVRALQRRRRTIRRKLRQGGLEGFERNQLRQDLRQVPFDIASARLDISELQQGRLPEVAGPDVEGMLAQIGQLKLALGIQTSQLSILGSFKNGASLVPKTGIALLHKGEAVLPEPVARRVRGGSTATRPIELHVHLDGDLAALKPKVEAWAIGTSDQIAVRIAQRAGERRRTGRY